jgi:hypothetical protein
MIHSIYSLTRVIAWSVLVAVIFITSMARADVIIQNTTDPLVGFIGRGDVLTTLQLQGAKGPAQLPSTLYVKVAGQGYYTQDFIKVINGKGPNGNGIIQHSFGQGTGGGSAVVTCVARFNGKGKTQVITGYEFSVTTDALNGGSSIVIHHPNEHSGWVPAPGSVPTLQGTISYTIQISTDGTNWVPLTPPLPITFGPVPTNF